MDKPVSLRTRLTLLLALATLVALGVAARVVDWRADSEMLQRFDASLLARAQAFAALVHSGQQGIDIDAVADRMARFPGSSPNDWYVVVCKDRVVAQSHPAPPRIATGREPRYSDARLAGGPVLRVVALRFRPEPEIRENAVTPTTDAATGTHLAQHAVQPTDMVWDLPESSGPRTPRARQAAAGDAPRRARRRHGF